ncbi:DUF1802 family protein [Gimesia sp.]|uniref:DUF1802 family protein n=1 Tax=Gimesia sp. TaxID=2024833 RepID=UPI000C55B519|nr:DUF1802 family protein [Gimesia sp.]MAX38681.1 hypothetical protein [Gimesia sp.]HAH46402.1 hypothetical protein [Planctomycetaceae bacterium]HBL45744.1 hypothetical protein [Planctomycetaceae bacterium]|tara:strand:- start:22316 stop:22888 length:573 start_codon:yes stop_codon:yes gene_type:complete
MQSQNRIALKEWGAVCAALEEGTQSVIVRKGGIHEGEAGFRVEHGEFWMFPTRFHQGAEQLQSEKSDLLNQPLAQEPDSGKLNLGLYSVVEAVLELKDPSLLSCLQSLQVLNEATIQQRFEYRKPGLFVLLVRVYRMDHPLEVDQESRYAGCHSWVELSRDYSTDDLKPVLDVEQFLTVKQAFQEITARA